MFWSIAFYSLLGCVSMWIQDTSGTVLVIAESRGKAHLAGLMDVTGDIAKFLMYAYSGTILMTRFGWIGWLGIIPILISGYLATRVTTEWASANISNPTDDTQDMRIQKLEMMMKELCDK